MGESRFVDAFRHAPIGMALLRLDGRSGGTFSDVNPATCELIGRCAEELVGRAWRDVTHPDDLEPEMVLVRRLLAGRIDHYRVEKRFLRPDGSEAWAAVKVSLTRDAEGRPQHAIASMEDISERHRIEERLQYLAGTDALTGLANRSRFEAELATHVAYHRRFGGSGAVIVLDLDRFKYANDTAGTSVGDEILRQVGAVVADATPEAALAARLGSDEFAVLLPEADADTARGLAAACVAAVQRSTGIVAESTRMRVSASAGVALFSGEEAADDVLSLADVALHEAKDRGGDSVVVHDGSRERRLHMANRLSWAARLRSALEDDGLLFYVQPIIELDGRRMVGVELLLRLRDERGAIIGPSEFLDAAEQFGLMPAIDRWAVREAALMAAALQEQGSDLLLEVNLSPVSVNDMWLVEYIEEQVVSRGIDPSRLVFEVTERAAIANFERARELVERLQSLGCRFALDDFGSGFGSFYNLKHLPFDYLKIDGEFVQAMATCQEDRRITSAIAGAARGLGKAVIAEYASDEQSLALLSEYGVEFAQGFHLGEPRPAWDLITRNGGDRMAA